MSAPTQIKSFYDRWERLEAEKKDIGELLKDLFAEAKSFGYDTKALRAAFRLKAKQDLDNPADTEFELIVDTYLDALNGLARDARLHARENIEKFDPETGEILSDQPASDDTPIVPPSPAESEAEDISAINTTGPRYPAVSGGEPGIPSSDAGGAKMDGRSDAHPGRTDETSAHINAKSEQATNTNSPETANEMHQRPSENDKPCSKAVPQDKPSPAGTGSELLAGREGRHEGEAASADLSTNSKTDAAISRPGIASLGRPEIENRSDKEAPEADASGGMQDEEAIHPATFPASASQGEAEAPSAKRVTPHRSGSAAANAGGSNVTAQPSSAATAGALVRKSAPATFNLRPHCLHRDLCRSGTIDHCHACKVAMREREMA